MLRKRSMDALLIKQEEPRGGSSSFAGVRIATGHFRNHLSYYSYQVRIVIPRNVFVVGARWSNILSERIMTAVVAVSKYLDVNYRSTPTTSTFN